MIKLLFSGSAFLFVFLLLMFQTGMATDTAHCPPSACGGTNISYPFRLETDPISCGDHEYELSCENNFTVLHLVTNGGKYYVQAINYNNLTIRLVDANVDKDDCSSLPSFPLTNYYAFYNRDPYTLFKYKQKSEKYWSEWEKLPTEMINFIKCPNPLNSSVYLDTSSCINYSSISRSKIYSYAYVGEMKAYDLKDGCSLEMVSLMLRRSRVMSSFVELHRETEFGFELSWHIIYCRNCSSRICYLDKNDHFQCPAITREISFVAILLSSYHYIGRIHFVEALLYKMGFICTLLLASCLCGGSFAGPSFLVVGIFYMFYSLIHAFADNTKSATDTTLQIICMFFIARAFCGASCVAAFLIYKWQRRHLSGYNTIEEFLQTQNNLMPIRYAYSDIKKMTGGFKEMLGKGGFGSVYKGKLRSGQFAAVKMLEKSKADGQDFINEVATIGRIHHANVVRLIGFCSEGSKHALVYEFMSNGSLDRHIFSPERSISLSWEKLYEISLGVARGIEYLHRGCEIQILHFDIKPHNILLNENFTPKVSDFGLAKLYPTRGSIASLTAARGTIGYMAPELFYKNIGRVSYKADVYSFGMLLLEMAGKRKNLEARGEDTSTKYLSQLYYPFLVYNKLSDGKLEIEGVTEEENEIVRKMIITGLWCIQMEPSNRPPMNKVVQMLEGDLESLELPPKPLLCPAQDLPLLTTADFAESSSQMESLN